MAVGRSRQSVPALLDELVARHRAEAPELAAAILDRLHGTLPEFFADPDVAYDMAAAVAANVGRAAELLALEEAPERDVVPAAAGDLLASTLQHGIPLISLLEAYREAQGLATDWWTDRLEALAPAHRAGAARRELLRRLTRYIDTAAADIRAAYEVERRALESSPDGRRALLVRKLLAGEGLDVDAAAATLGHPLRARHVALVLWRADEGAPDAVLGEALEAVREALGGGVAPRGAPSRGAASRDLPRVLTTAARHRVYAWLSTTGPLELAAARRASVPDGAAVAMSGVHDGVDGFVRAHEEAVRTAGLVRGRAGEGGGRVATHDEHELAVLLSHDADARDRFVRRVLGPLAAGDRVAARARTTLRAYLASGMSASRTAARLGVHRNTVRYRLGLLPDDVREVLAEDDWSAQVPRRLELELALQLVEQLGIPR